MSVVNIDLERLLEDYHGDTIVVRFGNNNHIEPYMELILDKSIIKDGRIRYVIKELSNTGEINREFATPIIEGVSLEGVRQNYVNIGLIEDRGIGSWGTKERKNEVAA